MNSKSNEKQHVCKMETEDTQENVVAENCSTGQPSEDFLKICYQLDPEMDTEFLAKIWKQYDAVGKRCLLEGNECAWMACAIYLSLWHGNYSEIESRKKYQLAVVLRICKISALEFFEKIGKWAMMVGVPRRLHDHINRVQGSLAITAVIFKKLLPIYRKMFRPPRPNENETSKIGCKTIFKLLWTFYITMKKQIICEDLLNSHHLLLCCIDFIFQDIRNSELKHLLKPEFVQQTAFQEENESVLAILCEEFDGAMLDAKHFRVHRWLPELRKVVSINALKVSSNFARFVANAIANMKVLNKIYVEQILKKGELDERMFLPLEIATVFEPAYDGRSIDCLRRTVGDECWSMDADLYLRMNTQSFLENLSFDKEDHPILSGQGYVISSDQLCPAVASAASASLVKQLEDLLQSSKYWKPNDLLIIMRESRKNAMFEIDNLVKSFGDKLEKTVGAERINKGKDYDNVFTTLISTRRIDVEKLFHRFLYQVAMFEKDRMPDKLAELSTILNREDFLESIFVLSLQLVLFCHESIREFPWSLEVASLPAINFYKVIELVIRADPELSRAMVKHLNKVEERVLEELAWGIHSPLWTNLQRRTDGVPSSQAVSLDSVRPYFVRNQSTVNISQRFMNSPVKQSGCAKRRLEFEDDDCPQAKRKVLEVPKVAPATATILFFRKVYYLAAVRMQDLCQRVRLDEKGRQRAWTVFEHILRSETSLMAGRHIDQNLMCCVYVVCKLGQQNISFHDIMYHYRHQPQANSRVYREVLIEHTPSPSVASNDNASRDPVSSVPGEKLRSESSVPKLDTSASETCKPQNLIYSDLIKYYNRVFIARVESFVKRLQSNITDSKENQVQLLSIPSVKCNRLSPLRNVTDRVTVIPMPSVTPASGRTLRYNFNRSPSKDLKLINQMVQNAGRVLSQSGGRPHEISSRTTAVRRLT